jgi:predicted site-specific integrase-resolvase
MSGPFLSPAAFAKYLAERGIVGVSERTVRRWVSAGLVQSVTLPSRRTRIPAGTATEAILAGTHADE